MKRIAIVIYPNTRPFFVEVAIATLKALQSLGHDAFESSNPGAVSADLEIIFGNGFKVYGIPLWPKAADRKRVFFNMEMLPQTKEQFAEPWRAQSIKQIEDLAPLVDGFLDTAPDNVEAGKTHLQKLGLKTPFAHCPPGYHESFDHSDVVLPQTTDVLFFGALTGRRVGLLDAIKKQASVTASQCLFGKDRDRAMAQAKINLNLHVTGHGCSLGLRVPVFFLSSGRFFVSEKIDGWNPLRDGEHYRLWDQEDPDFFRKLLSDEAQRTRIGKQGREFLKNEYPYSKTLVRALKELNVL